MSNHIDLYYKLMSESNNAYGKVTNVTFAKRSIESTTHHTSFGSCIANGKATAFIIDNATKKVIGEASLERCLSMFGGDDFDHLTAGTVTFSMKVYAGGTFTSSISIKSFKKDLSIWIAGICDHTGRSPQQVREIVAKINDILDAEAIEV